MNSAEAEHATISTLLTSDAPLFAVYEEEGLRPDHFQEPVLGALFRAMVDLDAESTGGGYDRVAVADLCRQRGVRDVDQAIAAHASLPARVGDLRRAAKIIRREHLGRALARFASEVASGLADPDAALERAHASLDEISAVTGGRQGRPLDEVVDAVIEEAHSIPAHQELTGVPSGYRKLDELTGGFQKDRLYVLAARPSVGKSALSNGFAINAAKAGHSVGIWNLEMADTEVVQRFLSSHAQMPTSRFMRGGMTDHTIRRLAEAGASLHGKRVWIDDTPDLSIRDLRARVRRRHSRVPLDLVVVDYLQLMRKNPALGEVQAIGEISRGLKILAKELHLPVIVLSQLNRDLEKRSGAIDAKRPVLSDLRGSGDIEQDADAVMFIFREDMYDPDPTGPRFGVAEILVPKNRGGARAHEGDIDLGFDGRTTRFYDLGESR